MGGTGNARIKRTNYSSYFYGFSILSIFEPIKDFSPTPLVPFESLGDIFQAVGVIIL